MSIVFDLELGIGRYLSRRCDCLQPIRAAVLQHPDLAPMIRALFAFATDGILVSTAARAPGVRSSLAALLLEREHNDAHGPL